MTINWNYPEPRSGLLGVWDRFVGPGATRAEVWLQTILPVAATATALAYGLTAALSWSTAQVIFAGIFAFDLAYSAYTGALLLSIYGVAAPLGLEWFLPVFYFKLLVSHLPKEEPYRPANEVTP